MALWELLVRLESAAACVETSAGFLNDLWEWARAFESNMQMSFAAVIL